MFLCFNLVAVRFGSSCVDILKYSNVAEKTIYFYNPFLKHTQEIFPEVPDEKTATKNMTTGFA